MARIGILTFWFAHNYGAVLQAYAIREWCRRNGEEADIIPYYPDAFRRQYEIDPFAKNIAIRTRVSRIVKYVHKVKQYRKFKEFDDAYLGIKDHIYGQEEVGIFCNKYDLIIFGSDQIWNTEITSDDMTYFGSGIIKRKISYAASFGSGFDKSIQYELVSDLLKRFDRISIREGYIRDKLEEVVGKNCDNVLDPVFLLRGDEWKKLAIPASLKKPYVLVYLLEPSEELYNYATEYAKSNALDIYEIHPTRNSYFYGADQLNDVGPLEFLGLVSEADCVCTNSYHAVAFSLIFHRKCLHLPNCKSPERSMELLRNLGICADEDNMPLYEFSKYDGELLDKMIIASEDFLRDCVKRG
ncbi:polysaccharide pyruvyl transferase family protein [Butyrivibrio sp. FCS014]|uniref:polysaccharide pyruvyl transferase family protein n=1 Tax=Butyrivibrio sp. FCS014 TaxID=1408304 RepID=UPI00046343FB|nr:polysaccharide pyruvyl transferase family protein [Butyrivibrio sp. FCS014]